MSIGEVFASEMEFLEWQERTPFWHALMMDVEYQGEPLPICSECKTSIETNLWELEEEEREQVRISRRLRLFCASALAILVLFFLGLWLLEKR